MEQASLLDKCEDYDNDRWDALIQKQEAQVTESLNHMTKMNTLVKNTKAEIDMERKSRGILKIRKSSDGTILADLEVSPK